MGGTRRSHPAFATIHASRVQGGSDTLFGSPIKHRGYVRVSVQTVDEIVSLSHSYYWQREGNSTIVELKLSEAQWAAFVSTMNVGSGVPCTLEYARDGETRRLPYIEDISYEEKRALDIKSAVKEQHEQLKAALKRFDELLQSPSVKKSDLRELRNMFIQPGDHAESNMEFRAKMLTEHSEHLIESAKAEVSAMVTRMAMQFPQLTQSGPEIVRLTDETKEG